jgi:beta-lactamase class A
LGDKTSRLDRNEPAMNRVEPGDPRDTVTPEGIACSVAKIIAGSVLSVTSRTLLTDWMEQTTTGLKRIRAGVPAAWSSGDKTGTGVFPDLATKINDVAVLYLSAGRPPLVVAGFYESPGPFDKVRPEDEAVLQRLGELAATWVN